MATIKHLLSLIISVAAFSFTFFVIGKFMLFLSVPGTVQHHYVWIINLLDNKARLETAFPVIVFNMVWIVLFILQHSLMKSAIIKTILQKVGLDIAERAVYCLTSSICLWYLITNWKPASTIVLWQIDLANKGPLWWTFILIHVFAWTVVYGGSIIMDLPEILGIKQVYYDMKNYAPPMAYKSFELRHLYGHVRHPSFTGLCTILWVTNIMSLDRLILALMFTLYMYISWSTDYDDIIYHKCQFQRKRSELKRMAY